VTAEPREVILSEEDLGEDHRAQMEELCRKLARTDPQEIEDEVWVRLDYFLCVGCKKKHVRAVRRSLRDPDV